NGELAEHARDLESPYDAYARALIGTEPQDAAAVEGDVARLGQHQAAEHVEQRRLAGAVGPDDSGNALARDLERAAGEGLEAAERLDQAARLQHDCDSGGFVHRCRSRVGAVGSLHLLEDRASA